ncbi:MAG TPA: PAS domain S-box protein, partial [Polyangiales bacterium]|nr:PAS domain S-box protein [Polyangiales bacterium]
MTDDELLRALLGSSSLRIGLFDHDGRLALASPGGFFDAVQGLPGLREAVRVAGAGQETSLTREFGGATYSMTFLPRRDASGVTHGVIAIANVAVESTQVSRALAEVQERERRIFHSNMVPMLYWDENGAITDANDRFLAMMGYTREELAEGSVNWQGMTPPEQLYLDQRALEELRERGTCTPFEKQYIHRDGHRIDILIGAAAWAPGESSGVAFIVDVTERKREDRALREAEERLRRVVDAAPLVLWTCDAAAVLTLTMGRGMQGLGLQAGDLVGMSAFDAYPDTPEIEQAIRRCLQGEELSVEVEVRGRTFDNLYTPLRDPDGNVPGVLGVGIDLTERRRAEAERERLQAQLLQAQKLESLGLLAGGIAHDFNNLLTPIVGGASAALLKLPQSSSLRVDLELIVSAAQRAAALTRQMLAYSGKAQLQTRVLDLSTHVREISTLIQASVPKKVELRLDLTAGLPPVEGDASQLQQIVMNLVINAAEAIGPREGTVFVMTSHQRLTASDAATLYCPDGLVPGQYVSLEVRDTGHGMDAATQAKIFDPFFTTKFTGRGLGLAAVLGIVRTHRGAISVESSPGQGTSVRVFFPTTERREAASVRPRPSSYRGQGRVLVIDDDAGVRSIARRMLETFGFSVLEAADGESGAAAFIEHAGDCALVLLDMTMPKLNGEETLRAIRRVRSDVPVLLMSGYNEL